MAKQNQWPDCPRKIAPPCHAEPVGRRLLKCTKDDPECPKRYSFNHTYYCGCPVAKKHFHVDE